MTNRSLVAALAVIAVAALAAAPATAQDAPRTPLGVPDLQGIWDFRTITPLERPEALGDQAFYTPEEAATLEREAVERDIELWEREAQRTEVGGNVGAYNNFWMDRGTSPIETGTNSSAGWAGPLPGTARASGSASTAAVIPGTQREIVDRICIAPLIGGRAGHRPFPDRAGSPADGAPPFAVPPRSVPSP